MRTTTREFLLAFLNVNTTYMGGFEHNERARTSCLSKAFRAARLLSGRDMRTGTLDGQSMGIAPALWNDEESPYFLGKNSFIGVLNYLIILEIIGNVVKKRGTNRNSRNGIFNALKEFSNYTELINHDFRNVHFLNREEVL